MLRILSHRGPWLMSTVSCCWRDIGRDHQNVKPSEIITLTSIENRRQWPQATCRRPFRVRIVSTRGGQRFKQKHWKPPITYEPGKGHTKTWHYQPRLSWVTHWSTLPAMQGFERGGLRRERCVPWTELVQLCLEGTLLYTERERMSQGTNPHSNSLSLPHPEHLPLRIFIFCPEYKSVCLFIIPPGSVLPVTKTERIR